MSIFDSVFIKKPGRSLFNLSHERKFSCNFGYLYPVLCTEVVPGDTFKISTEMFIRSAPLISPVMHRVNVKLNYFFVPNRLLWNEWESFITGVDQRYSYDDPENDYFVQPVPPYTVVDKDTVDGYGNKVLQDGGLADFLGFPTHRPGASVSGSVPVKLMPFYAYNKIYVDWFRNQNVEGGYVGAHDSGLHVDASSYFSLRVRNYEKDYFTGCLPFAQRGDAMPIPVATGGSIEYDDTGATLLRNGAGNVAASRNLGSENDGQLVDTESSNDRNVDNSSNLKIADASIGTINDLRVATRIQRWLEKNARVGGRYIEQILAHFGVRSSDARLQRAEYLGGFTLPIVISDVEQNSATVGGDLSGTDTPQGTLAGKSSAYGTSKPIKAYFEEHGFLMCILSILPRTTYQDGLSRMWTRDVNYDYYFPEFANLGEQQVLKNEVFYDLTSGTNRTNGQGVFGYQERYCEYKYIPSTVHGEFKGNLDFWHLGRKFSNLPALNHSFTRCATDSNVNRIFSVTDNDIVDHFYVNLLHHIKAMRPMPKHSIPTL